MKICFVVPRFPFPILKGDTLRAYHQIKELSRQHTIHLIALSEEVEPTADAKNEMLKYCESIEIIKISKARSIATVVSAALVSKLPLQVLYFRSAELRAAVQRAIKNQHFDVIHAMTIRVVPAVINVSNVPVVVDFMDSYGANIATRRLHVNPLMRMLYDFECSRIVKYERDVARQADAGIVIAELDRKALDDSRIAIIPNGVDFDAFPYYADEHDSETVIFTGNMGYQPNVDAVTWFVTNCWPKLRECIPGLRFRIVGARPAPSVLALSRTPGIEVTGQVESMVPYLNRATVAVCPIRCGSGMQNKVLEAMAVGVPVVTNAFVNRSIAAQPDIQASVVADNDAAAFTEATLGMLRNKSKARRQAAVAREFVETQFTWSYRAKQMADLYQTVIARRGPFASRALQH